jgi:RHS repeat-associated protein
MNLLKAWNAIAARATILARDLKPNRRPSRYAHLEHLEPRRLMTGTANPLGATSTTYNPAFAGNPIFFPGQTTQIREAPGADGGNPSAAAISPNGVVEYGSGVVQLAATPALFSDVGVRFGQSLLWSNQDAAALGGGSPLGSERFGNGMSVAEIPELITAGPINFSGTPPVGSIGSSSAATVIVRDGSMTVTFDASQNGFQARGPALDTLSQSNGNWVFTDSAGDVIVFNSSGTFQSISDPAGDSAVATYDSSGRLSRVDLTPASSNTVVDSYVYSYSGSSPRVRDVALFRLIGTAMTTIPVQQVKYTYYDDISGDAAQYGNSGDLMLAQIEDGTNWDPSAPGQGQILDTTYFRYFTPATTTIEDTTVGYVHGLRSMFSNAAFARLAAKEGSVLAAESADDLTASDYADVVLTYGEYGAPAAWVTTVTGALGTDTYSYATRFIPDGDYAGYILYGSADFFYSRNDSSGVGLYGPFPRDYANYVVYHGSSQFSDYNEWASVTEESAVDGGTITTWTNFAGETVLVDRFAPPTPLDTTGPHFYTGYVYDSSGRLVAKYNPSVLEAGTGAGAFAAFGVQTKSTGLIELTDYNPTGDSAAGYVKDHRLQNGGTQTSSNWTYTDLTSYTQATAGNVTINLVASRTLFSQETTSLTTTAGAEVTTFSYDSFYSGTVAVKQITETLPGVTDQSSSGTIYNTLTAKFDQQSHPIWEKDSRGFLTYLAFDVATGSLTSEIKDVATSSITAGSLEATTLPSDWSTPSGGGLNLTTTISIDGLGRAVRMIDAYFDTVFWVYLDPQREVRTYRGWKLDPNSGIFSIPTGQTPPPIEVTIDDLAFAADSGTVGKSYSESFTMVGGTHSLGTPDGTEAIAGLKSLSVTITTHHGIGTLSNEIDEYHDLSGLILNSDLSNSLIAADGSFQHLADGQYIPGDNSTNYYTTLYASGGSPDTGQVTDPNGNVGKTKYDALGRVIEVLASGIGSASSPTPIADYQYDPDGNLTQIIEYPDYAGGTTGAPANRVTQFVYDWRDRQVAEKRGLMLNSDGQVTAETLTTESADHTTVLPISYATYDNLDQITGQYTYAGSGVDPATIISNFSPSSPNVNGLLRSEALYARDAEERVQSVSLYDVNQSTGDPGTSAYQTTSWQYDGNDNVVLSTSPLLNKTSFYFDGVNRLIERRDPNPSNGGTSGGPDTVYNYASDGHIGITDPNGHTTSYFFDAANRLAEIDQPAVTVLASGHPLSDAAPNTIPKTYYGYGTDGTFSTVQDPNGHTTTWHQDALGRTTSIVRPQASLLQSGPNAVSTASAATATPTSYFTYDGNGNLSTAQDENGGLTSYYYNSFGEVTRVISADPGAAGGSSGPQVFFNYDNLGDLLNTQDANNYQTDYNYNTLAQTTEVDQPAIDALQSGATNTVNVRPKTSLTYDVFGFTASETDPNGNQAGTPYSTVFTHDSLGRLRSVTRPNPSGSGTGLMTSYGYDVENELTSVTDPLSNVTTLGYDRDWRRTSVKLPNPSNGSNSGGPTYNYTYDPASNLLTVTDPFSNVTTYGFSERNQLASVLLPNASNGSNSGGPLISFYHDSAGNQTAETDPDGNTTFYSFNALNQLTSKSELVATNLDPTTNAEVDLTATTQYLHDAAGNLTRLTDADGRVTDYAVNYLGQQTQEAWFDSSGNGTGTIDYHYNSSDARLHDVVAAAAGGSVTSSYTFDYNPLGWLKSVENTSSSGATPGVPDVKLTSQYDLDGNRTALAATIDTGTGSGPRDDFQNSYAFDALGRETSVSQQGKAGGNFVGIKRATLGYDNANRLTSLTYFNGYNGTGYSDASNGDTLVPGNLTQVAIGSLSYDHTSRLTGLSWYGWGGGSGAGSGSGGGGPTNGYFEQLGWGYDNDSRVGTLTNSRYPNENLTYLYNHDSELTSAAAPYGGYGGYGGGSYSWDANGDSTLSGRIRGKGNRLLSDGTYKYVYDESGNVIQRYTSTAETDYFWDNRGRLVKVQDFTKSGSTLTQIQQVDYTHDAFDRLIGRSLTPYSGGSPVTASIATARFVYDGDDAVLAFNVNQSLTDRYLWGPAVDQILADERFVPSGSNWLPSSPGTTYWALTDNEGSVRDWVSYGSLVDHIVYDSFGKVYSQSSTTVPFAFGHNGVFYDPATGLEWHQARWYNPALQRWMSEDPSGLGPDSNPYRYVGNSPTNFVDPSGLRDEIVGSDGKIIVTVLPGGRIVAGSSRDAPNLPEAAAINIANGHGNAADDRWMNEVGKRGYMDVTLAGAFDPEARKELTNRLMIMGVAAKDSSFMSRLPPSTPIGTEGSGMGRASKSIFSSGGVEIFPEEDSIDFRPVPTRSSTRPSTLRPGPFAGDSIPSRGPGPLNAAEQRALNQIGNTSGCHTCGASEPGTTSGNWIGDHQPPSAMTLPGQAQRRYPHCLDCSKIQGGQVRAWQQ